jgi:hypothetical protein
MSIKSTVLSEFWSDDRKKHAEVVAKQHDDYDPYLVVHFYQDGVLVATENYEGKNEHYHEDAAENFVLGVKHLD